MSMSAKGQHEKMAKKIIERRGIKNNNDKPAVVKVDEAFAGWNKKRLKALLDENGVKYGKDDKRDVLIASAVSEDLDESDEAEEVA